MKKTNKSSSNPGEHKYLHTQNSQLTCFFRYHPSHWALAQSWPEWTPEAHGCYAPLLICIITTAGRVNVVMFQIWLESQGCVWSSSYNFMFCSNGERCVFKQYLLHARYTVRN